jgi:octaprenyl-diphosphate synthase
VSQAASSGIRADQIAGNVQTPIDSTSRLNKSDMDLIYAPIADDLRIVDELLLSELHSETPWVDQLLEHNWLNGGKRMRPVLLLLSGACCGPLKSEHHRLAAAVEMIHAATLVHDDILDDAETRRHQPTVNSKWGNRVSVLLGDYLFTHAFYLASGGGSAEFIRILAASSNRVCEGEMRQNACQGDFGLSEAEYLGIIADKTAELCGCSCRLGAMASNAPIATIECFSKFGRDLGVAFQIIDDVLDLVGRKQHVGKTLGTDLSNQKATLPVIHCLAQLDNSERSKLLDLLQSEADNLEKVLDVLQKTESIEYAREVARKHAQRAANFAEQQMPSEYGQSLHRLATFILERTH